MKDLEGKFSPVLGDYELWPFSMIEWAPDQGKFRARAMIRQKQEGDIVVFSSWHADFADAERPIALPRTASQETGSVGSTTSRPRRSTSTRPT